MMRIAAWLLAALIPLAAFGQTLPQSTIDRQAIATLQWRLSQPGLSEIDRLQIARRITELQYRIATGPAIAPMPTLAPFASQTNATGSARFAPTTLPSSTIAIDTASHCDTLRIVITYLTALRADPSVSAAERSYNERRIATLHQEGRAWRCPSAPPN